MNGAMPTWDAGQYLRFAEERTRPCRELAARVAVASPRRIIDLGCGPGNSTAVVAERWPMAGLTGLDSSAEMIAAAAKADPGRQWIAGDIATWAFESADTYDVVFSNAALQWVPDHPAVYPRLMSRVNPGGALAVQIPSNEDAPAHRLARELAASANWKERMTRAIRVWHAHAPHEYYDFVASHAAKVDLWETEYQQVMPAATAILEWYKGTGLRPYLDALAPADRPQFEAEYLAALQRGYAPRPDGRVLFPFRRLFLIAYRT